MQINTDEKIKAVPSQPPTKKKKTKIPKGRSVLNFEFRYWSLFRI